MGSCMKCKVCNKIEVHIIKLLALKLALLWKHGSQIKVAIVILSVVAIGDYYFLKTNQQVFNECLYVSRAKDYVCISVVVICIGR
jgi:hypothetical protein